MLDLANLRAIVYQSEAGIPIKNFNAHEYKIYAWSQHTNGFATLLSAVQVLSWRKYLELLGWMCCTTMVRHYISEAKHEAGLQEISTARGLDLQGFYELQTAKAVFYNHEKSLHPGLPYTDMPAQLCAHLIPYFAVMGNSLQMSKYSALFRQIRSVCTVPEASQSDLGATSLSQMHHYIQGS